MKLSKRLKKINKLAFTLIEMTAVIVVLGITVMIAVPLIARGIDRSKEEAMKTQENLIKLAGEDYFLSNRQELPKTLATTNEVSLRTLMEEGYIEDVKDYEGIVCDGDLSYVQATNTQTGEYDYFVYLFCDNYHTSLAFGQWSPWQLEPIAPSSGIEIETTTGYNSREITEGYGEWGEWDEDPAPGAYLPLTKVLATSQNITGTENEEKTVYNYEETAWKWHLIQNRCVHAVTANCRNPLTNNDSQCTTICNSTYGSPTCPSEYHGEWWYGPVSNPSTGYACYCGYSFYYVEYWLLNGGAWYDGSCPSGYSSYATQDLGYYPGGTTQALGQYSVTAPSGYPLKDTSQTSTAATIIGSPASTTLEGTSASWLSNYSETYPTGKSGIDTKYIERTREIVETYTPVLEEYVLFEEFKTSVLTDLNTDTQVNEADYDLYCELSNVEGCYEVTMYRYRTVE